MKVAILKRKWKLRDINGEMVPTRECPVCSVEGLNKKCKTCKGRGYASKDEFVARLFELVVGKTEELFEEMRTLRRDFNELERRVEILEQPDND